MRILVVGSGGREHALVWKLAQSKLADKVFCAPGNGGISQQAECIDIKADDMAGLLEFAQREKIDLTVVGPEAPLAAGMVDEFNKHGVKIFGPCKAAAQLEASKSFSKQMMMRYNVPTAEFRTFIDLEEAKKYISLKNRPLVVKADGLAQGKGVVVTGSVAEGLRAAEAFMLEKTLGDAGNKLLVEELLVGEEASILALTDGRSIVPLVSSQDHKRIYDNDQGPNTGGMGAYAPAPVVSERLFREIVDSVFVRIIEGLAKEGIEYKGLLYAGVMITKDGPKVLEFNVRFGDPETQAVLPLLKTDLVELMLATANGKLSRYRSLEWERRACVSVVCASGGYPGDYAKGKEISGLDAAAKVPDAVVFHAGTRKSEGKYFTNGGRVLGVTGLGDTVKAAIDKAYQVVGKISFEGMHYRKDIGRKAMSNSQ